MQIKNNAKRFRLEKQTQVNIIICKIDKEKILENVAWNTRLFLRVLVLFK